VGYSMRGCGPSKIGVVGSSKRDELLEPESEVSTTKNKLWGPRYQIARYS